MGIINRLAPHVANCIAAGEVVERPASVVKELLENCIDAGATSVTVEIRGGGIDEIIVADDGCGMAPDDAVNCFLRHATSKIETEADLDGIATLGFRGEALAAIAAVSRIELITRPRDQELGTRLYLEAGDVQEREEYACPTGTRFTIRNLFYNTPARMKFLRKVTTEGMHVAAVVTKLALSHPEVRITFTRDGKEILSTAGDCDLHAAIYSVCGRDFAATLEQVTGSHNSNVHVWGYVTRPECARGSRSMQYMFLNGRSIQSKTVMAALEEAYRGHATTGKFPGCVLHLAIEPGLVDANVHPAKLEVKFADEHGVFEAVYYAVRAALEKTTGRPSFHLKEESPFTPEKKVESEDSKEKQSVLTGKVNISSKLGYQPNVTQMHSHTASSAPIKTAPRGSLENQEIWELLLKGSREMQLRDKKWVEPEQPEEQTAGDQTLPEQTEIPMEIVEPEPKTAETVAEMPELPTETPETTPDLTETTPEVEKPEAEAAETPEPAIPQRFRVLGELFGTYIIAEYGNEAIIIDKHAAHERIRYEQLLREQEQGSAPAVQTLVVPVVLTLEPAEAAAVAENEELLRSYGVGAESFGGHDLLIRELPADVAPENAAQLVTELARAMRQTPQSKLREAILHRMACHSAIRAGEYTTYAEMEALTKIVLTTPSLKHCPHGRPVAMIMTKQDFIRNFER